MNKLTAIILSLAVSLATVFYLILSVDLMDLGDALRRMDPSLLVAGFLVLQLNYLLRTWRIRMLLNSGHLAWPRLLGIVQIYGALNFLLPARMGELSFPILIKRYAETDYCLGTGTLVAARILDMLALVVLLPFALALSANDLPAIVLHGSLLFASAILVIVSLVLVFLYRQPYDESYANLPATSRIEIIRRFLVRMVRHLSGSLKPVTLPRLIAVSSAVWLCIALNLHILARAAGTDLPFFVAFAITMLMIPLSMLPLQGFANLGTYEVSWISVLVVFGLSIDAATQISLFTHVVLVLYVILLGGLGLVFLISASRHQPQQDRSA